MSFRRLVVPAVVALSIGLAAAPASRAARHDREQSATRQADLDALLAADRAYAAAAAQTTLVPALAALFRPDVIVPGPAGLARGADAVIAALKAVPENAGTRVEWAPIGGGVSADGQHGYTFGFMTARPASGAETPMKYMTYWIREGSGWKAAGYKRARRGPGDVSLTMLPGRLPSPRSATTDAATLDAQRRSLAAAESAFSDRAQTIGLGPAFVEFGAPTAVNMGGPTSAAYVVGNTAIGAAIGAGAPGATSPVVWASDSVIVASSGDLGISFGYIKAHTPPPGAPERGAAFFTIWARVDPSAPWRYVAE